MIPGQGTKIPDSFPQWDVCQGYTARTRGMGNLVAALFQKYNVTSQNISLLVKGALKLILHMELIMCVPMLSYLSATHSSFIYLFT